MAGWLKVHRKVLNNEIIMQDIEHFAVWMYLLLQVKYEPCHAVWKGEAIILEPGQCITGRLKIARELHMDDRKVRTVLEHFKKAHQITQESTTAGSLITIVNWKEYQKGDEEVVDNSKKAKKIRQRCAKDAPKMRQINETKVNIVDNSSTQVKSRLAEIEKIRSGQLKIEKSAKDAPKMRQDSATI